MNEHTQSASESLKYLAVPPEAYQPVAEHNLDFGAVAESYDMIAENLQLHRQVRRLQEEIRHHACVKHELNNLLDCTRRFISLALTAESRNLRSTGALHCKVREYLEKSKEGIGRMINLLAPARYVSPDASVKDVSGLTRPDQSPSFPGNAECNYSRQSDINAVVRDAVDFLGCKASDNGVSIKVQLDENLPEVETDDLFLVFVNLIDNAFDAMKGGGTLKVSTNLDRGKILVRFSDDGDGIPDELRANVFDAFFTTKARSDEGRLDASASGSSHGKLRTKANGHHYGLGLNICQQVVQKHNGSLCVDSCEGKGTAFTVAIPVDVRATNRV